uniref:Down syndrome cell adhesion molecule-like protein Dscam2 n=1 Tax=Diabrotica virgifera virgifera TaxID=50390 RepID=A0A6P7FSC5_DIAVI
NDEMETRKTTALTTVITGLRKFTNYSLQVLAFTKVGDGVLTTPSYCQTEEDVPGPPADLKVVVSSPQSLKVSWLQPVEPNGVLTKYNLYRRSMDGRTEVDNARQTISSQNTIFEVKSVQSHIEYQFWVTASTRIGEGQSSKVVSQVATPRVPARIISFGGVVVRPWRSTVSFNCEAVGAPKREWLRNDQILKIPPIAPLLYVTSATSSSVLLHWKAGNNGGASISGFTLNYKKEHGDIEEVHLSRHATSYELKPPNKSGH